MPLSIATRDHIRPPSGKNVVVSRGGTRSPPPIERLQGRALPRPTVRKTSEDRVGSTVTKLQTCALDSRYMRAGKILNNNSLAARYARIGFLCSQIPNLPRQALDSNESLSRSSGSMAQHTGERTSRHAACG